MKILKKIKTFFTPKEPTYDIDLSFVSNKPLYTLRYVVGGFYPPIYLGCFDSKEQVSTAIRTHRKHIKDLNE
jgi:hypothetical protein